MTQKFLMALQTNAFSKSSSEAHFFFLHKMHLENKSFQAGCLIRISRFTSLKKASNTFFNDIMSLRRE